VKRKTVGIVAVCIACIAPAEGLRRVAYSDPVGIPTICFGETKGVKLGDTATTEECQALLAGRLERDFIPGVERCITRPASVTTKGAMVSLAYNIGVERFCSSSITIKWNAGDTLGACNAFLLYTKAKGIELPGLVKRRGQEREMCLRGLA
jgi:lysozyme